MCQHYLAFELASARCLGDYPIGPSTINFKAYNFPAYFILGNKSTWICVTNDLICYWAVFVAVAMWGSPDRFPTTMVQSLTCRALLYCGNTMELEKGISLLISHTRFSFDYYRYPDNVLFTSDFNTLKIFESFFFLDVGIYIKQSFL